jgi:MSHA biogenesis protein MshQ
VASGQGTATASPAVSGTVANATTTVNFNCQITQGGINYTVSSALSYTQNPPLLRTYTTAGPGTETTPAGYTKVTIELWGGGGGGSSSSGTASWLGGGGGGAYSRSQYTLSGAGGDTINYNVGQHGAVNINGNGLQGGPSSASSGSLAVTTMTANGGQGAAGSGAGGTASGGNQANASGTNGTLAGAGGTTTPGVNANPGPTYGVGGAYGPSGNFGTGGLVAFYYSSRGRGTSVPAR